MIKLSKLSLETNKNSNTTSLFKYISKSIVYNKYNKDKILENNNKIINIIGGGTVGKILALLLSKSNLKSNVFEKHNQTIDHPRAHYISPRSCEILSEINVYDKLNISIKHNNYENWKDYLYCNYLFEKQSYFGKIDHFEDQSNYFEHIDLVSNSNILHIAQNKLNKILIDEINKSNNISYFYNAEVYNISKYNNEINENNQYNLNLLFKDNDSNNIYYDKLSSNYTIGCDGSSSIIRKCINANLIGQKKIQSFLNIYFISKNLFKKILFNNKTKGMLYFLFNPKRGILGLICYDIIEGEYCLQVPYHEDFTILPSNNLITEHEAINIILDILVSNNDIYIELNTSKEEIINDLTIKSINKWEMKNVYTNKFYDISENKQHSVFIIGDASHQYPPSGGFGLNHGISDAFSLANKIALSISLNNNYKFNEILFKDYNKERKTYAKFISKCAYNNYNLFIKACKIANLNPDYANFIKNTIKSIPLINNSQNSKSYMFNKIASIGYNLSNTNYLKKNIKEFLSHRQNLISLIHPNVDYGVNIFNNEINDYNLKIYSNCWLDINYNYYYIKEGSIYPNTKDIEYNYLHNKEFNKTNNLRKYMSNLNANSYVILVNNNMFNKFYNNYVEIAKQFILYVTKNLLINQDRTYMNILKLLFNNEDNTKNIDNIDNIDNEHIIMNISSFIIASYNKKDINKFYFVNNIKFEKFKYIIIRKDHVVESIVF